MESSFSNVLEEELKGNSLYNLETIDDNKKSLIKLSSENVKKVETMLRYNSYYVQFNLEVNTPESIFNRVKNELDKICVDRNIDTKNNIANDKQYEYSSTYYIKAFKYLYDTKKNETVEGLKKYYESLIYIILRKINSENRTRVSLKVIDAICNKTCEKYDVDCIDEFINVLREPVLVKKCDDRKYELIDIISDKYDVKGINKAFHLSLATKFCHFFAFYFFDEDEYRDGFSIYDQVVKDNLVYYFEEYCENDSINNYHYDTNKKYNNKYTMVELYKDYQKVIDKILINNDERISRNGFDHIVWYTNKGQ